MGFRVQRLRFLLLSTIYILLHSPFAFSASTPDAIVYLKKDPLPQEINHIVAETLYTEIDGIPEPNREVGLYMGGVGGESVIEAGKFGPGKRVVVTGAPWGDVNIRTGPGMMYDMLTIVHNGDELEVLGKERWYQVRLPDGTEGWITHRYVKELDGGTGSIFFRPYRFDATLPILSWRLTIKNDVGDVVGEMANASDNPTLPSVIAWSGTDRTGKPVKVGDRLIAQLEVQYPNDERSLSPYLYIRVVPPGHIRTTVNVFDVNDPNYVSNPALTDKLQNLATLMSQYDDEFVVVEYFHPTNNEAEARAYGVGLLERLQSHPAIRDALSGKRIFVRAYIPPDPASPLFYQQYDQGDIPFDQSQLVISSVKVQELLYDPVRAKRYNIRVDRGETVVTTATGLWYNIRYADRDPNWIAFWGKSMFGEFYPAAYEGRWLRGPSIDLGLGVTYGHTETIIGGDVANSNTTGIDKAYGQIDLTWWGFPFRLFGDDLGAMVAFMNNTFDRQTDVEGNTAPTPIIRPDISFLWTNLQYRFAWGPYYDSPQVWAKVGYLFYDFNVDTSPLVVVDHYFNSVYLGGRFLFPLNGILTNLNAYVDAGAGIGEYVESGRTQAGVSPSNPAAMFRGEAALTYWFTKWLSLDAHFWVNSLFVNFNPSGSVIETYWGLGGGRIMFRF
ncbi:MAG: hypothetical protein A3F16_04385 [Deltaproteobacteria bacterium RIFCSPHIGHO2_12_FULL_43_9]|nr:MAG: hypothetical protein A3F16_04385 [Deltaproteobacteria bacterium RIFCSPHIGHO2_12_FULL_43_9]